jgi:hypothetical protein
MHEKKITDDIRGIMKKKGITLAQFEEEIDSGFFIDRVLYQV